MQNMNMEYKRGKYLSRKVVLNVQECQDAGGRTLDRPMNIMRMDCVKTMIVDGVKKNVGLPSGEEILATGGILDWQEDLQHLRNQLTVE